MTGKRDKTMRLKQRASIVPDGNTSPSPPLTSSGLGNHIAYHHCWTSQIRNHLSNGDIGTNRQYNGVLVHQKKPRVSVDNVNVSLAENVLASIGICGILGKTLDTVASVFLKHLGQREHQSVLFATALDPSIVIVTTGLHRQNAEPKPDNLVNGHWQR